MRMLTSLACFSFPLLLMAQETPALNRDLLLAQLESEKLWEQAKGRINFVPRIDGKVQDRVETGDSWRGTYGLLVEALLRLGESSLADEHVRDCYVRHPWASLAGEASALATRCSQPSLAALWAALGAGR